MAQIIALPVGFDTPKDPNRKCEDQKRRLKTLAL